MRFGIIGNCKSAALVDGKGSIEWCCLPNLDSPSVFAGLLDERGGRFKIESATEAEVHESYLNETNILCTEFDDGQNAFVLIDFMPRYREGSGYRHPAEIHRLLKPLRGKPSFRVVYDPRLNYAQGETFVKVTSEVAVALHELEDVFLYSSLPLDSVLDGRPVSLEKDEFFLFTYHEKIEPPGLLYTRELFEKTKDYWETWARRCRLPGLRPHAVLRSALTLKLMTFDPTGAIVAAPTTSLPEALGEERNWDYRYCWLRDSSLMLEALKSLGHFEEAKNFIHFLLRILESKKTKIQIVYGIDGRTRLKEKILPHLKGYKGCGPVRVGNHAALTKQHDIFGEILNTIYLYFFHYQFEAMTEEIWSLVKFLVETLTHEWMAEDSGLWEYRFRQAHFTYSKMLSWVGVDRGCRIAEKLGRRDTARRWRALAEHIRSDVEGKGWNETLKAFTQTYGSSTLDVSVLQMERYGFIPADDPRWVATVRACERVLLKKGFGFRYTDPDDFGRPKSSFILATFWIAKALHSIGEREKAFQIFEKSLSHANGLGLLSEDIDPDTGELLGNFPQAFSHMALINTANALNKEV